MYQNPFYRSILENIGSLLDFRSCPIFVSNKAELTTFYSVLMPFLHFQPFYLKYNTWSIEINKSAHDASAATDITCWIHNVITTLAEQSFLSYIPHNVAFVIYIHYSRPNADSVQPNYATR